MSACLYCAPAVTPTKGSRSEQRIMAHVPLSGRCSWEAKICSWLRSGMRCLSGMVRELVRRLNGATLRLRVVDDDRRPRLELLLHVQDLRYKRHFLCTVGRCPRGSRRLR